MADWLNARRADIDNEFLDWKPDGVWVKNAGWVDVPHLLSSSQFFFKTLIISLTKKFTQSITAQEER